RHLGRRARPAGAMLVWPRDRRGAKVLLPPILTGEAEEDPMMTPGRWRALGLAGAVAVGLAACAPGTTPSVKIEQSNISGESLHGNVAVLHVSTEHFKLVEADGDRSGETGHLHLFIDREPVPVGEVIPDADGIVHATGPEVELYGLTRGPHRVTVVLGDGAHTRIHAAAEDHVEFTVEGPVVRVSAPERVARTAAVPLRMTVNGVTLKKADGDSSGRSGHLHVFVDREPIAAGETVPVEEGIIHTAETSVRLPGLAPGEHVITVVLGDGTHRARWSALVADRTVVTVG
ncbi:MAG: DUF4399 domain-containing protein, partial [Actinomycetota bacterium]|nr:DUF4399 domain-containing protein [Actinomycetota bacterium]